MSSLKYFGAAALVLGFMYLGVTNAADDKKYTIKEVMKAAHGKEGLLNQAKAGTIKDDDKKVLVAMYVSLGGNKPPKGDAADWKKITDTLAAAAKDYGAGKDEKAANLAKAANCKACHSVFK
jgi:hypothetical protein